MIIDEKYTWNLKDIFENDSQREECRISLEQKIEEIVKYKGALGKSVDNIYNCYKLYEEIIQLYEKYYCYAMLLYHKDMSVAESIKIFKQAEGVQASLSTKTAFITPELTNIEENTLKEYIQNPKLEKYKRILQEILDNKKHVLSEKEENILAMFGEVFNASENIYDMISEVEMEFPEVNDEKGNKVRLTHGMYSKLATSKNREVRKEAYYGMYDTYKKFINTFTETYLTKVKKDTIISKLRNYKSSLEKAVKNDDSTLGVYSKLVEVVNNNININHEYIKLKKQLLKLDELHMYDMFVNPLEAERVDISYEDSKKMVLEGLSILGEEYISKLKYAFDNRWIDVYETPNKKSGGYNLRFIWSTSIYIIKS